MAKKVAFFAFFDLLIETNTKTVPYSPLYTPTPAATRPSLVHLLHLLHLLLPALFVQSTGLADSPV